MHSGTIALVGRSNVGKSTFLNHVLGEPLAIVSPLPQTTRDTLRGVVRRPEAELVFLDTPGLHQPKTELGRRMNARAVEAAREADAVLFMTDVAAVTGTARSKASALRAEDQALLARLDRGPVLLAVNKVDLLRDKSKLLPALAEYSSLHAFSALVPISVARRIGIEELLRELETLLPEGGPVFDEDTLTDRPARFFAREYIREQILNSARGEVPHAVAVSLDAFEEGPSSTLIRATLHAEKVGQRKILIGAGGSAIGAVRVAAARRIAELLGTRVRLELFVRVTPRWKDTPRQLAELGYETAEPNEGPSPRRSSKRQARRRR